MKPSTALIFLGAAAVPFAVHETAKPATKPDELDIKDDAQKVAFVVGILSGGYALMTGSKPAGALALGALLSGALIVAREKQVF